MVMLRELDEVQQKAVMNLYLKGRPTVIHGNEVEMPKEIMVAYRCVVCRTLRYIRVHINDAQNISEKVSCTCGKDSFMRMRHIGASNISLLVTPMKEAKRVFTLDDFFEGSK